MGERRQPHHLPTSTPGSGPKLAPFRPSFLQWVPSIPVHAESPEGLSSCFLWFWSQSDQPCMGKLQPNVCAGPYCPNSCPNPPSPPARRALGGPRNGTPLAAGSRAPLWPELGWGGVAMLPPARCWRAVAAPRGPPVAHTSATRCPGWWTGPSNPQQSMIDLEPPALQQPCTLLQASVGSLLSFCCLEQLGTRLPATAFRPSWGHEGRERGAALAGCSQLQGD